VITLCFAGVYSFRNSWFDLFVASALGIVGFFFVRYGYQLVPILLGALLGPEVEKHMRQGLMSADGDISYFVTSPIAAGIWSVVVVIVVGVPITQHFLKKRKRIVGISTASS